jgi:hypothetical protein
VEHGRPAETDPASKPANAGVDTRDPPGHLHMEHRHLQSWRLTSSKRTRGSNCRGHLHCSECHSVLVLTAQRVRYSTPCLVLAGANSSPVTQLARAASFSSILLPSSTSCITPYPLRLNTGRPAASCRPNPSLVDFGPGCTLTALPSTWPGAARRPTTLRTLSRMGSGLRWPTPRRSMHPSRTSSLMSK